MKIDLKGNFAEFRELKNIDRATAESIIKDVFKAMLRKRYETDENFDVVVNDDRGDIQIWHNRMIVESGEADSQNPHIITIDEALKIEEDFEVGEEYSEEVELEVFGRRAIQAAKQTMVQKFMELERDNVYKKYKDRVGEIVTGEVYQIWKREILVLDDEDNELILPKSEQIPTDYYKKGDTLRAVILKVDTRSNNPRIIISRVATEFLERLFELEVPEIFDGLISIKKIVRQPGERAKVAVESYDDRIDPVGACVGMKGSRIHGIVRELRNESIDVINYTDNAMLFIQRSLSPAKISNMKLNNDSMKAEVYLHPEQVSLAIGKGGHNIKLAAKLTGYEIDVFRETDEDMEDVDLDEFADEIDGWILDQFKANGIDTARQALELSLAEMSRRMDLEEETAQGILQILKKEFED